MRVLQVAQPRLAPAQGRVCLGEGFAWVHGAAPVGRGQSWVTEVRAATAAVSDDAAHSLCCWACALAFGGRQSVCCRAAHALCLSMSHRSACGRCARAGLCLLSGGSLVGAICSHGALDSLAHLCSQHRTSVQASGRPTGLPLRIRPRATFSGPGAWCLFSACSPLLSQQGGGLP